MGQAYAGAAPADSSTTVVPVGQPGECGGRCRSRLSTTRTLEDDYEVGTEVLGEGMSGQVRLATSKADGQKYAVKSFKKSGLSAQRRASLRSEASIYLSLDHPHIARLHMVYETADKLHFVMEHMAGGELYDRWSELKQFTEDGARSAIRQVFLAVAYLHANNVAHRDLKLQNLMYEAEDSELVKLIDFGIAEVANQNTTMSQACGSIHYVAPEVLAKSYTNKADVWSMGVIVYMLLTGSPPFYGSDNQVLNRIRAGAPQWSKSFYKLSAPAREFLQSLLVLDSTQRLSAQQALDHQWMRDQPQAHAATLDAGIVCNLQQFARASKFRRQVLSLMAWSLSKEEGSQLCQQFLAIDTDKTGTVDVHEFTTAVTSSSYLGGEEAEEIFRSLDTDGSGCIEYSEFLAAALLGNVDINESVLRRTYARFDCDGDGRLEEGELSEFLGSEMARALLAEADFDGNGELDFEEFSAYFHRPETPESRREEPSCESEAAGPTEVAAQQVEPTTRVGSDQMLKRQQACGAALWAKARVTMLQPGSFEKSPTLLSNMRQTFRRSTFQVNNGQYGPHLRPCGMPMWKAQAMSEFGRRASSF